MSLVLIADGEPFALKALGRLLQHAGYQVVLATDASELWRELAKNEVELVITDARLPGGSGLELVRTISEERPDVALVLMTPIDDPRVAKVVFERDLHGYLIKPLEGNALLVAVRNALRRRALEVENRQCRRLLEEDREQRVSFEHAVHLLSAAFEFRESDVFGHIKRFSCYCRLLAERLGWDALDCERLGLASAMHDVGKIGVDGRIFLKRKRVTTREFTLIKAHSDIGYRVLSGSESPILRLAAEIAYTHHERYDGSGYPRRLKGEQIPIEGRIAAVADVFDALTTRRVYRKTVPVEQAIDILRQQSGTGLEPELVELFLQCIDDVVAIKERYSESGALAPVS